MSKVIKSPADRWAGEVIVSEPLTVSQVFAIEDALDEVTEIAPSAFRSKDGKVEVQWQSRANYACLPAIILCVEKWKLKDFPKKVTRDTFPSIQSNDATKLISTIFLALMEIYREETQVPNE